MYVSRSLRKQRLPGTRGLTVDVPLITDLYDENDTAFIFNPINKSVIFHLEA